MEVYLRAFVNFDQNHWAGLLPMAKVAYNNAKNLSTGHTPFEMNCSYPPWVFFEEDTNPPFQSKLADDLSRELQDLMNVCRENLYHAQELQKQAHKKASSLRATPPVTRFD